MKTILEKFQHYVVRMLSAVKSFFSSPSIKRNKNVEKPPIISDIKKKSFKVVEKYATTYDFLNHALFENASRRGVSAFRFGLIPQGASDHLPIAATIETSGKTIFSLVSWNLLADVHLYNNFMNVTGTKEFFCAIQTISNNNIYCLDGCEQQNKLYHYFSELAHFLYEKKSTRAIEFNAQLLQEFNDVEFFNLYPSHLARSRTPEIAEKNKLAVVTSRKIMSEILLDSSHPEHYEFRLAIQHSLELYHHIKYGALKWENRFPVIKNNQGMIASLKKSDFLCLQECTEPEDFKKIHLPHAWITHKINAATNDHCVLAYNQQKFKLIDTVKGALGSYFDKSGKIIEGNKPFIFGKFEHIETGERMIMASIHHPGGNHHCMSEILEAIKTLRSSPDQTIDFFVAGDYNHTQEFFNDSRYAMNYPKLGTMAGSDYGNINQAIDAVLSDHASAGRVHVERVAHLPLAAPAEIAPSKVHFYKNGILSEHTSPSFWKPVQREVSLEAIKKSDFEKAFGVSSATFAPRISL